MVTDIEKKKLEALSDEKLRNEVKDVVVDFFAEECEVEKSEFHDTTNLMEAYGVDSLMYLELIEIFKKKYNLNVELKAIGKYSLKRPVKTLSEVIDMQMLIIKLQNDIVKLI